MTWATGTADAPRLYTYQEAVAHEAKVVPIRRKVPECKPLGRRDCTNLTIRKEKRSIVVSSWGVTVTYRPSGAIDIRVDYRASTSDRTLLRRLLGVRVFIHNGTTWIEALDPANPEHVGVANINRYYAKTGFYPMKVNLVKPKPPTRYMNRFYTATLRPVFNPVLHIDNRYSKYLYTMDNIVYPKRKSINRAGAAAVRARYKPMLTLLSGYLKMMAGQEVPRDNPHRMPLAMHEYLKTNKAKLQGNKHLDVKMEFVQMLAYSSVEYFHRRDPSGKYVYGREFNAAKAFKSARNMLYAAHKDEAFTTTTVTYGRVVNNRH